MRYILNTLLLGAIFFAGCASSVESFCSKVESCGELGDKTYAQCVADMDKQVGDIREKNNKACDKIIDAYETFLDCAAGLSCTDFKGDLDKTTCKQSGLDFQAAAIANEKACNG